MPAFVERRGVSPKAIARIAVRLIVGATTLGVWIVPAHRARAEVIIVVDTAADVIANDGFCSLREAITAANNDANYFGCIGNGGGFDLIEFGIGAGTPVINIASSLPTITRSVEINGGPNRVELRGPGPASVVGLNISNGPTGGTSVRNLVINGFLTGIQLTAAPNVTITGNRIGTNAAGTAAAANGTGIVLTAGAFATVGGTTGLTPGGPCTGDCNLISGNSTGLRVNAAGGPSLASVTAIGNYIGTNNSGMGEIGNTSAGIEIGLLSNAGIGGTTAGSGNLISGNSIGVFLNSSIVVQVQGNRIGTNVLGTAALPNLVGVYAITPGSVQIGESIPGSGNPGNLISGNATAGVFVSGGQGVSIRGNRIGTQDNGTSPLPNGGRGIEVVSTTQTTDIGGVAAGQGNVIAYNNSGGISVGAGSSKVGIRGNSIRDNISKGIFLNDFQSNTAFAPLINGVGPVSVTGTACPGCLVDVYSDGADEGATYHGTVTANGGGTWSFSGVVAGPFVTATATTAAGSTSEFSAPFTAGPPDFDGDGFPNVVDNCVLLSNPLQCDSDGDGFGNQCDGDLNNSGLVSVADYALLRSVLGQPASASATAAAADMNCSGTVTTADYAMLRASLGLPPGPSGLHP